MSDDIKRERPKIPPAVDEEAIVIPWLPRRYGRHRRHPKNERRVLGQRSQRPS